MSWQELPPVSRAPRLAAVKVATAFTRAGWRLRVTVRPALLGVALPWWVVGRHVRALLGGGDHTGLLRFEPAAAGTRLYAPSGVDVVCVQLALSGVTLTKQPPVVAAYAVVAEGLQVTLPAWACLPRLAPVAAVRALPKTPFVLGRT